VPPIRSIADLPFHERHPRELLRLLFPERRGLAASIDYGWARVPELALEAPARAPIRLRDAVVLGLHWNEEHPPIADDIDLEFAIVPNPDFTDDADWANVLASRFLEVWLPRIGDAPAYVLALCNPDGAALKRPRAAGERPVYYGLGDVESRLHRDEIRLRAAEWRIAS
jgi:hypothetical protein